METLTLISDTYLQQYFSIIILKTMDTPIFEMINLTFLLLFFLENKKIKYKNKEMILSFFRLFFYFFAFHLFSNIKYCRVWK